MDILFDRLLEKPILKNTTKAKKFISTAMKKSPPLPKILRLTGLPRLTFRNIKMTTLLKLSGLPPIKKPVSIPKGQTVSIL